MLITNNLGIQFEGGDIIKNVNISLDSASGKKVALVGRNGCGKSTLFKMLLNEIKPTHGSVISTSEVLGYLPQNIDLSNYELVGEFLESKIEHVWDEYKIEIALRTVGLDPEYIYKEVQHLSGGEKVKIALAGLLMDEPTILLCDEPTNNLDAGGVEWLIEFMKNFKGSIIFVSHDRYLINEVAQEIWEIDPNTLGIHVYGGNYNSFLKEKEHIYKNLLNDFNLVDREIKRIEAWLREHEFHPKYQFSSFVMSQKKKLAQLKEKGVQKPQSDPQINIRNLDIHKKGLILKVEDLEKRFGEQIIFSGLSFKIHKGERVLVAGKNGSGKSTLLNLITGDDKNFTGTIEFGEGISVGFLRQHSLLDTTKSILQEFEKNSGVGSPRSRSILSQYGFGSDMVLNRISTLSYGQLKRLDLAIILARNPSLFILDEPTNHLDIYTREDLEEFIMNQKIPMIIVSHDKYFLEKIKINKTIFLDEL